MSACVCVSEWECVSTRLVLLCDMISCSHSMYNAFPKLYVACLSAPPPQLSNQGWADILMRRALALECFIWLHIRPISARFMTSGVGLFHQIPRRDTIHGCSVWYLLCFQICEPQHCRRAGGVVRRNPLYFQRPTSYLAFSTFTSWKKKEKKKKSPRQLLLHPPLNYTIVIKQHTFNHSLC